MDARLALAIALGAGCWTGDVRRTGAAPEGVPAALAPPADQAFAFALDAHGVQRYRCDAAGPVYTWTFVAPQATLVDGELVAGRHYAGPTWESADGSVVAGTKLAGATVDATAIPWLLVQVTSHAGPVGRMTDVTSIQRIKTTAGLAPTAGCDSAHVGATSDVPYTATYAFYRRR